MADMNAAARKHKGGGCGTGRGPWNRGVRVGWTLAVCSSRPCLLATLTEAACCEQVALPLTRLTEHRPFASTFFCTACASPLPRPRPGRDPPPSQTAIDWFCFTRRTSIFVPHP
eukprot:269465-Pleurochrysis_carterae.AAC.2